MSPVLLTLAAFGSTLGGGALALRYRDRLHYLLGFTSLLADNISSNVIGLALGTAFRFSLYRLWVFSPRRGEPKPALFPEVELGQGGGQVSASPSPASRPARQPRPARRGTPRPGAASAAAVPQSD